MRSNSDIKCHKCNKHFTNAKPPPFFLNSWSLSTIRRQKGFPSKDGIPTRFIPVTLALRVVFAQTLYAKRL